MNKSFSGALCAGFFSLGLAASADAALLSRLGGQAVYDTDLDITWAANANINGVDTWSNQQSWVSGLTIGGVSGWRLPSADVNGDGNVINCSGGGVAGCADNEMGFLFWEEGITSASPGVFSNVEPFFYWSGTELAIAQDFAWDFNIFLGNGVIASKTNEAFAWAVRDGDVITTSVPTPSLLPLIGIGLIGMLGLKRRKNSAL